MRYEDLSNAEPTFEFQLNIELNQEEVGSYIRKVSAVDVLADPDEVLFYDVNDEDSDFAICKRCGRYYFEYEWDGTLCPACAEELLGDDFDNLKDYDNPLYPLWSVYREFAWKPETTIAEMRQFIEDTEGPRDYITDEMLENARYIWKALHEEPTERISPLEVAKRVLREYKRKTKK